jgi:tetratricopeptide (TPR) repeat protein
MTEKRIDKLIVDAKYYFQHKEYERELEIWREVCRIEPDNPFFKHNIALALMNIGKYAEALQLFDYLVQEYPRLSRVHNNRAKLLMRMGFELRYLTPLFIQALTTSEDIDDLTRHFHNVCGSIVYGSDEGAEQGLEAVKEMMPDLLERMSPPDLLGKNIATMSKVLCGYQKIAAYRKGLTQRKWRAAESALKAAKTEFRELGLDNFVRGIDLYVTRYFVLCRDVVETLERIGSDSHMSASIALRKYSELLHSAQSLRKSEKDSFHVRLVEILIWFMRGMIRALEFLVNPVDQYREDNEPLLMMTKLSSVSYVNLCSNLASLLRFVDRQCKELMRASDSITGGKSILYLRDKSWGRISLFCNGVMFDFKEVDTAIAKAVLGWEQEPIEDAKLKMCGFKAFVERQAYKDILVDGKAKENIGRALLQAFLLSRSYREIPVRGGRTDILQFVKQGRFLYELKVWRGPNYYQQGLRELGEYVIGETDDGQLVGIFYVILDPTKTRRAESHLCGVLSTAVAEGKKANLVIINLSLPQPSRKS